MATPPGRLAGAKADRPALLKCPPVDWDDLARRISASRVDVIPSGWLSKTDAAKKLGYASAVSAQKVLAESVQKGWLEQKMFRVICVDGKAHPKPYYRLVKVADAN